MASRSPQGASIARAPKHQNNRQQRGIDGALAFCSEALDRALQEGTPRDALREVRASLRLLTLCARREGLAPEQMLIRLKRMLDEHEALRALRPPMREDARGHVIRMAISTYFDD